MKNKILMIAGFTVTLLSSSQAMAHGYYLTGGAGSNAEVIAQSVQNLGVLQEDETGAIKCQMIQNETYACNIVQKHRRPLADISEYSLGNYMEFELGESSSNADAIFKTLTQKLSQNDELTIQRARSSGIIQLTRNDGKTELTCLQDTSTGIEMTECRIDDR